MSDLPQPQVVITHESDLDGFVSGHLLQRLANHLFDQQTLLQAWNYTNFERRPLRENCAWVCDLNFSKRMDRDNWLIVDHHQTDVDPQRARLILDHSKSASLLCYELCKEHGLGNEKLDRLVHFTNVGDLFLTDDPHFTEAIDYGSLIKQYMFWNIAKLIEGDLESLIDHPLIEVIATRRRIENPIGYEYAKAHITPLSDTVAMIESPIGDTNAVVHQMLTEEATPHPVILTAVTRNRSVSVSVRSRNGEALPVAKLLQGGGHPNACGATLPQTVQRIPDAVEYLKKTLNPKPGGDGLGSLGDALEGLKV
ncbi:MAG: DHHA1 domain-containing protein [Limisphaerales bacterium]|jgi:oligoribonuclease NrnB/cAMP/cGMP phosphodiesterase (DHH superfamily)|nr:DHHA1 domain-containing protein [Verrucomicrobiota bacterium]